MSALAQVAADTIFGRIKEVKAATALQRLLFKTQKQQNSARKGAAPADVSSPTAADSKGGQADLHSCQTCGGRHATWNHERATGDKQGDRNPLGGKGKGGGKGGKNRPNKRGYFGGRNHH